jgi:hypothetical protein
MHPFRTLPDTIDGVICGRCTHPAWDHCDGDTCSGCEAGSGSACTSFVLAGFTATIPAIEEPALRR